MNILKWMVAVACATVGLAHADKNGAADLQKIKSSFRAEGIAGLDRIEQDEFQALCSDPLKANAKSTVKKRAAMEAKALAEVQPPQDGNYMGSWKEGEKIAQSGRGATWTDKPDSVNGGGCYNCHQIDKKEISHGTIGPSLYNYGKIRGTSPEMVKYTWNKISNAKAYNACSNMPRFAHFKLLTQDQIRHLVALLMDPESPVNQ